MLIQNKLNGIFGGFFSLNLIMFCLGVYLFVIYHFIFYLKIVCLYIMVSNFVSVCENMYVNSPPAWGFLVIFSFTLFLCFYLLLLH